MVDMKIYGKLKMTNKIKYKEMIKNKNLNTFEGDKDNKENSTN